MEWCVWSTGWKAGLVGGEEFYIYTYQLLNEKKNHVTYIFDMMLDRCFHIRGRVGGTKFWILGVQNEIYRGGNKQEGDFIFYFSSPQSLKMLFI